MCGSAFNPAILCRLNKHHLTFILLRDVCEIFDTHAGDLTVDADFVEA